MRRARGWVGGQSADADDEDKPKSKSVLAKLAKRAKDRVADPAVEDELAAGRVLGCISSRPGQSGRADGYILEGKELEFYVKKMARKKK